ncbi:glycosyltransferase family 2 protein, partial [Paracoccus liaowanqingii]
NEESHIEACLRSLFDGDEAMQNAQVVVADGGSTDRTREIVAILHAEFSNITLIDNPERLQSAAMNCIVESYARFGHTVLVRCDAHTIYPKRYVLRVARSLLDHKADALAVPMDSQGIGHMQKAIAWVSDSRIGSGGSAHRGGRSSGYVDHGHHAGFLIASFLAIGGYDASFSHNEDAEFDYRLRMAGGQIWLDADIRIKYRPRASLFLLAQQYWYYGRGRARTVFKHRLRPRIRQILPVINVIMNIFSFIAAAISSPIFLVWPGIYLALLLGTGATMALQERSFRGFYAGPALGTMHLAWGLGFIWQSATWRAKTWRRSPARP